MNDQDKSQQQLLAELHALRRRVSALEAACNDAQTVEAMLEQSHDELRAIYEGMVDGLLIADVETQRFARANASICRMLGYSERELLAMSVRDIHPPEELPEILERFRAQAGGTILVSENRAVRRKDGSVFYADITAKRIVYHGRLCLIGFFRDITERRQAQEALRHRHDELRVIYDGMPDGLVIVDIEAKQCVRANSRWCEMLGYAEHELPTTPDKVHPPEEIPAIGRKFQAQVEGSAPVADNIPFLRKDGTLFFADISANRIEYNGRQCLISFIHDVTERRNAQAALEREQLTLRHLLQSSDHERQLIAYEIHDGLAQQLAAAIMQFQTYEHLKDRHPANAKTAYDAGVQMLRQAHFEARRLISGVRPPILDESGIAAAIAHLVHDQKTPRGPQIEYHSRVAFHRLTSILENAIYRIAQEALTNACKHSRSEKVRVSLTQGNDLVCLEVRDWGIGFDVNAIGEERFGIEGIKERVRLLGGRLSLESKAGEGTCLRATLPILEREQPGQILR